MSERAAAWNSPRNQAVAIATMSRQKYTMEAIIAPTWMIAVNAVMLGSSTVCPRSFSTTVRWPVLEMGRNSVTPSTMPRRMASHQLIMCAAFVRRSGETA